MGVERELLVKAGSSLREVLRILDQTGFGAVIVVDEQDHLAGLVTDGDVRRALLGGSDVDTDVASVMNPRPFFVYEGMTEDEIRSHLSDEIRHIPVIDSARRVTRVVSYFPHGLTGMSPALPVAAPSIGEHEVQVVADAVRSGWVSSQGDYVRRFEREFAAFCDTGYASSASSGTAALHLALAALRVGPGDEVIVPGLAFIAVANAVAYCGAQPVFADVDPETWCIDPARLQDLITPRTRALIPVHLYGHPADMTAINEIAAQHQLTVIEDAAEAHGARCNGRPVGSLSTIGCFSFYGNKIITTGEGGMVVTDDEALWSRVEFLKSHAMSQDRRYLHPEVGFNYRMTNMQAALGVAQLARIEELLDKKRQVATWYEQLLHGVEGVQLAPRASWAESVFWMYSVVLDSSFPLSRDALARLLAERGIETRPFFHPLHLQPAFASDVALPVSERLASAGLNLPSSPTLSYGQVDFVCSLIREAAG